MPGELAEICPDYIIQDEFHRIGAEKWGEGVQKLLKLYPDAKLLGLSATNIRYLDNQRDMADELFDGNVAFEMTLGEAIVRGILNAPKYVLSVFAFQEDYDRLKFRVRRARAGRSGMRRKSIWRRCAARWNTQTDWTSFSISI